MFWRPEVVGKVMDMAMQRTLLMPADYKPIVAYIGAATYDLHPAREKQTSKFVEQGCELVKIDLVLLPTCLESESEDKNVPFTIRARNTRNDPEYRKKIDELHASIFETYKKQIMAADIIVISGGNTLFAMDRMIKSGIDETMREKAALEDGAIFCGGSAGLLTFFDSGHSDSMETLTSLNAMVGVHESESQRKQVDEFMKEKFPGALGANISKEQQVDWEFVRIEGLRLLPGFGVPHADTICSNDKVSVRTAAFQKMFDQLNDGGKGGTERGVCLDHYCGLVIDGNVFEEWPLPGDFPGSTVVSKFDGRVLLEDGEKKKAYSCADFGDKFELEHCVYSPERKGRPGIWIRDYDDNGVLTIFPLPKKGLTKDLYRSGREAGEPEKLAKCRQQNPDCWD